MKERSSYNQLEMFSETGGPCGKKNDSHNIFAGCLKGHEKIIILIIGFIITSAISFSLGMERGKKTAAFNIKDMRIETANTAPQKAQIQGQNERFNNKIEEDEKNRLVNLPQPQAIPLNKENKAASPEGKKTEYTIQLASYKSSVTAKREAEKLKSIGHKALVMTKGNYVILCVGKFTDKETAKDKLSELKKKYHDGILRRL